MSNNGFKGESEQSTPNTKNTNQATVKSKASVVSCSRIVPPEDQDDELKGYEKIYLMRKSFAKSLRFFPQIIAPESTVREDIALPQSPLVLSTGPQSPLVLSTVNYIQAEVIEPKAGWIAPPEMENVWLHQKGTSKDKRGS